MQRGLAGNGTDGQKHRHTGGKTETSPQQDYGGDGRKTGQQGRERGGNSPAQKNTGNQKQGSRRQQPGALTGRHTSRTAPGTARLTRE